MNLKIRYFKILTEFEFARKFYLKGLKLENENLENKPNVKKSNLRDYDENPIVIKDNIMLNPFRKIIFIIWQMSNRTPEYFLNLIRYYKDSKNLEICFYNDKIQKNIKTQYS